MSQKTKLFTLILFLCLIGLSAWGYFSLKSFPSKPSPSTIDDALNDTDSSSSLAATDDLSNDSDKDDGNAYTATPPVVTTQTPDAYSPAPDTSNSTNKISSEPTVSGSTLAHITPEHCNDQCKAFKMDLKLFEYCQQVCGISPIKNVSSCDDQKDIQKDYCLKDLAITKKDISTCDKISDANLKQTCKSRIQQDIIEGQ